jgi:hypothetical protein
MKKFAMKNAQQVAPSFLGNLKTRFQCFKKIRKTSFRCVVNYARRAQKISVALLAPPQICTFFIFAEARIQGILNKITYTLVEYKTNYIQILEVLHARLHMGTSKKKVPLTTKNSNVCSS